MLSHIFYDLLSPRIFMSSSISAIILPTINYQQHKTLNTNQLFSLMIIIWFVEQKQPTNHAPIQTHKRIQHISQYTQQKSIVRFVVYYLAYLVKNNFLSIIPETKYASELNTHTHESNNKTNMYAFDLLPLFNLWHHINIKKTKKINQALNLIYNF